MECMNIIAISPKSGMEQAEIIDTFWTYQTPIQLSVEGEFRQHDGLVTILMFYRRRASPKHRYNIIEENYGGGGHRTRLRDQEINCCV